MNVRALVLAVAISLPLAALGAGVPRLNAYFQQTLTSAPYQQQAFARVAKAWRRPGKKGRPALGSKTVVAAVIALDGSLQSVEIKMKSGSEAWDRAALAAVKKAGPFPK